MIRRPPRSTLFPYPPLSRSLAREAEPVEPQRIVLPEPRGEDVRLPGARRQLEAVDRKSTRLNSSHLVISYAVFCLKKKTSCSDAIPPFSFNEFAPLVRRPNT